jgi:hypothetical protein
MCHHKIRKEYIDHPLEIPKRSAPLLKSNSESKIRKQIQYLLWRPLQEEKRSLYHKIGVQKQMENMLITATA